VIARRKTFGMSTNGTPAGKGEKVGQEPTAAAVMLPARQTPRGARPNRRGELARLVER